MNAPVKVAVIGAECTGKTTLCRELAAALPGLWLPERVREFCATAQRTPRRDEQLPLLEQQIDNERITVADAAARGLDWVLCDSAPLVIALCSVYYFDDRSLLPRARAHQRSYAATLLLAPDLDWEPDSFLRDGPAVRDRIDRDLIALLDAWSVTATTIVGRGPQRTANALTALRTICNNRDAR